MDLYRKDGAYFRWSRHHWVAMLDLAKQFGWIPTETISMKRITDTDAKNLAAALELALPDIPGHEALQGKRLIEVKETTTTDEFLDKLSNLNAKNGQNVGIVLGGGFAPEQWASLNLFERFAGMQSKLQDFVAYLRVGGCEIH